MSTRQQRLSYGYKDPSIDLLRRAYFHIWDEESVGEEEGEGEGGGEGNEEEVEGGGGEELEVGEGGDDEDYEREAAPPSDMDGCDWDVLSASFMT